VTPEDLGLRGEESRSLGGGPVTLGSLAKLIRSKNAGPFVLTVDVMFDDTASFKRVAQSGIINRTHMAAIFGMPTEDIDIYLVEPALAIKISFPRPVPSGSIHDSDIFGGQQYAPLVNLEVP
jgi:hypothetical protein